MAAFSKEEKIQYARHFNLPQMGEAGQERLRQGRVLVIGAGGLGCPALSYLAAAGVGNIGIVDPDTVSRSNLQRQVLYGVQDIGHKKAEVAKTRLAAINPHIQIESYPVAIHPGNAFELLEDYDLILDGTDNFATRYLINDACVLQKKVNIYASIFRFDGQVAVFNGPAPEGQRAPNYRDLFPTPPPPDAVPDCATGGVLGVLPGIVGTLQATEAIKLLAGIGEPLNGQMLLIDALDMSFQKIAIPINPSVRINDLQWYDRYCQNGSTMAENRALSWAALPTLESPAFLVDVRSHLEHERASVGGTCLPLPELASHWDRFPPQQPIVFYCQTGKRSAQAVELAIAQFPEREIYHLKGGMEGIESE